MLYGGVRVAAGGLDMPNVLAGDVSTAGFPRALTDATASAPDGERWLTVTASLAADTPWAAAGHEIAFAQALLAPGEPPAGKPPAEPGDSGPAGAADHRRRAHGRAPCAPG